MTEPIIFTERSLRYRYEVGAGENCWSPLTLTWASPADAWLVAHDLVHHLPEDDGTVAHEIASLGAELFCSKGSLPDGIESLISVAASLPGLCFEACAMPSAFMLPSAPPSDCDLSGLEVLERSAVGELEALLSACPEPDWARAIEEFSRPGAVCAWIRYGFSRAQSRFASREAAHKVFRHALYAVKEAEKAACAGDEICVNLVTGKFKLETFKALAAV